MSWPLLERLPPRTEAGSALLLDRFLDYVAQKGLSLYPAQEEAILELFAGRNVILNTPTGSGKSLVASALHFQSLAQGRRSVYTCPIKALVNEKFLALCREHGASLLGDALRALADPLYTKDVALGFGSFQSLDPYKVQETYGSAVTSVVTDDVLGWDA